MKLDELDYQLPDERIAHFPLPDREAARMLVLDRATGAIADRSIRDLPDELAPGDVLVRNVSRVLPARLRARRRSGAAVELLLLAPDARGGWQALARPRRRLRDGEVIVLPSGQEARLEAPPESSEVIVRAFDLEAEMLSHGEVPLPPYLARAPTPEDRERYQTIWAREPGSVAAPTAGFHFGPDLLGRLLARGVELADVVLHVGAGTFQPVRTARLEDHPMHAERFAVGPGAVAAIAGARARGSRVVALGTTALRALESAASGGALVASSGMTRLLILPGHRFRVADALVTNFHQPRSTLLALVAAFAGLEAVQAAYREALARGYRFLSYGDAMLVR